MTTLFQVAGKCKYCESVWDDDGVPIRWYCATAPDKRRFLFADEPCDGTLTAQCPWRIDDGYGGECADRPTDDCTSGYEITDNMPSRFDQPGKW